MLDLNKLSAAELGALRDIVNTTSDKSEIERYFLFTTDAIEKAKVFLFCNRFLISMSNLLDRDEEGSLGNTLDNTIKELHQLSEGISYNLMKYENGMNFRKSIVLRNLRTLVSTNEVNIIIDLFAVLTNKISAVKVSTLKGIVMEGKSGEEAKKIFKEPGKW